MTELTRQCLSLPKSQRERLAKILLDSVHNERIDDGSRFNILLGIATEVCGQGVLSKSREFNLVVGRRLIAYQMRKEGFSYLCIARLLGKHHSTIIHMIRMMEDAIHFQFDLELAYLYMFQQKLMNYDTECRTNQGS